MRFQTKIRTQMLMVGLGAALLMAGSARAQQDMDPTSFDINPGTPAVSKAVVVRVAQNKETAQDSGATSALAVAISREATLEAGVTRMAIVDAAILLILFGGLFSIVVYARAATRRERMIRVSQRNARYAPVSAATAQ
jgi:hypothetical protein